MLGNLLKSSSTASGGNSPAPETTTNVTINATPVQPSNYEADIDSTNILDNNETDIPSDIVSDDGLKYSYDASDVNKSDSMIKNNKNSNKISFIETSSGVSTTNPNTRGSAKIFLENLLKENGNESTGHNDNKRSSFMTGTINSNTAKQNYTNRAILTKDTLLEETDPISHVVIKNYTRILDQLSDDAKTQLFGCKTMPFSNDININNKITNHSIYSTYSFRVLIAEESDQIACRNNFKVLLDRSYPKGSEIGKIRPNELRQYMFCSMLRAMNATKYSENEKFRAIPNSDYIILTRIFYLNTPYNRYALNLCLPNFLLPVITEDWTFIKNWLDVSQKIFTHIIDDYKRNPNKLKKAHDILDSHFINGFCTNQKKMNHIKFYSNSSNLSNLLTHAYPAETERIISILKNYLLPSFKSSIEIPRVFLFPPQDIRFVETWFKSCFKWMELKDGSKLNLLQTALATVIINYKNMILHSGTTDSSENAKIFVLSGNATVANKLIFLICGLLNKKLSGSLEKIDKATISPHNIDHQICVPSKPKVSMIKSSVESSPSSVSSFSSIHSSNSNSSRYISTRKGWEIPKRATTTFTSTYISPRESPLAEVIQASSFKSGNSLRYLSSSLTSQQSSYGSWLSHHPSIAKWMSRSPSVNGSDSSWVRASGNGLNGSTSVFQKTSSSTSLHQSSFERNGQNSYYTPQPSPSIIEYENSPWFETPGSLHSLDLYRAPTNATLTSDTDHTGFFNDNLCFASPLSDLNVQRDCQRVDESSILNHAFDLICEPNLDSLLSNNNINDFDVNLSHTKTNSAPVMNIDMGLSDESLSNLKFNELLPRYSSYLPDLNRYYQIQAIPYTSESDSLILSTMKKDLHLDSNTTLVRSLIISLRTRDIYEMMVRQDEVNDKKCQRIRKIFSNGKVLLKHSSNSQEISRCIEFITNSLERARGIYHEMAIYPTDNSETQNDRNREILHIFHSIINYSTSL